MKYHNRFRVEIPKNYSGKQIDENKIEVVKDDRYIVENDTLDGDSPKELARIYFYEKGGRIKLDQPKTWDKYIVKTAEKWYPIESLTEFIINRIGQEIGIHMNDVKLVRANGQIRFLSRYFLRPNEILIHGAEICGDYLGDRRFAKEVANNKEDARDLFTYDFIKVAIQKVFPDNHVNILKNLAKMIIFDAIVGNNDRHFYNWGVITSAKKTTWKPVFSPVYDSARGLFWNVKDDQLLKFLKYESKLEKYIQGSCPRISTQTNKSANHFELVQYILNDRGTYMPMFKQITSFDTEEKILKMLDKELFPIMNVYSDRIQVIRRLIQHRFHKIRTI